MTSTTHPTWLDTLTGFVEEIRRLDLKIHNDTHLEPAPTNSQDQVHSSIWSRTRVTSRGAVIAELEYSGCLRVRYQDADRRPDPLELDGGLVPGQ